MQNLRFPSVQHLRSVTDNTKDTSVQMRKLLIPAMFVRQTQATKYKVQKHERGHENLDMLKVQSSEKEFRNWWLIFLCKESSRKCIQWNLDLPCNACCESLRQQHIWDFVSRYTTKVACGISSHSLYGWVVMADKEWYSYILHKVFASISSRCI